MEKRVPVSCQSNTRGCFRAVGGLVRVGLPAGDGIKQTFRLPSIGSAGVEGTIERNVIDRIESRLPKIYR